MRLSRTIELIPSGVHTTAAATNETGSPIAMALQAAIEFSPGDIDATSMVFTRASGERIERKFIVPGEQPTGKETWIGAERPAGAWLLSTSGGYGLLTRFSADAVERTYVNWTAKSRPGVTFGAWSPQRNLQRGESVRLEMDIRARGVMP
jgi:hypothetical protein